MTIMLGDLRAALIEAGASPEKADLAAAEVVAFRSQENRLAGIEAGLMRLIYMAGLLIAMLALVLVKLFHG